MVKPKLIGLDWGTSSLRAYLFDDTARIVSSREAPSGIQTIRDGGFRAAFESLCADWLAATPSLPVIACGMIGSRQGWREAAYAQTPAGFDELAATLLSIDDLAGRSFRIVPGISTRAAAGHHDVIRGEETQVFGALERLGLEDATIVLPGTHSKWVEVRGRRVVGFRTYMTGELFAVLAGHSILGRLFPETTDERPRPADDRAFRDGLARALEDPAGLSSLLFSVRAEGLFGVYEGAELPSYLSGLLLGTEIAHARRELAGAQSSTTLLIGADALVERYEVAMHAAGLTPVAVPDAPVAAGLHALARHAGLLERKDS